MFRLYIITGMNKVMPAKTIVTGISVWLVGKSLLNLILGFHFGNFMILLFAVGLAILLMANVSYMNYVVAILSGIVVLKNLPYNLMNAQLLYLLEAVVDAVCVILLVAVKDIRELFKR